jgi:hypothetical protein
VGGLDSEIAGMAYSSRSGAQVIKEENLSIVTILIIIILVLIALYMFRRVF